MNIVAFGAMLNAALYLAGCFVVGLVLGYHPASVLALLSAGLAYLAYCLMLEETAANLGASNKWRTLRIGLTVASLAIAVFAGIAAVMALVSG